MRKIRFRLSALFIALVLFKNAAVLAAPVQSVPAQTFATHTFPAQTFIEQFSKQVQNIGKVPGGAIAIFANGRLTKLAFGKRGLQDPRPVDSATVFRIASLSKTFTGELAGLLVADDVISWDAPVHTLIPELLFSKAATTNELQFQHLLSQSTGILPYAYDQQLESQTSLAKIIPQFAKAPILCRPGTCYGYQNSLFSIAGLMMERKTGSSFGALLNTRVFKPLGMKNSSVGFAAFQAQANIALPHVQDINHWRQVAPTASYYAAAPAAGVNSSINDLAIWLAAQLGAHADVIPDLVLQEVTRTHIRSNKFSGSKDWQRLLTDEHYGLGWRVLNAKNEEIVFHSGGVRGYRAQISFSRKHQVGMVIVINAERNLDNIAVEFWCDVLRAQGAQNVCGY